MGRFVGCLGDRARSRSTVIGGLRGWSVVGRCG